MSVSIVVNSTNAVYNNGICNTFVYQFANGGFTVQEDSEMCISQLTIPYSWGNVNAIFYNNASFQYTWTVGTTETTYTVTLPNGYYTLKDIQTYLASVFIANGHYLIDSTGKYVYYINLYSNQNYYTNQLVTYPVPTSLPSGYTQPSGFAGYPTTASTPRLIILSNNFGKLIGFSAGSYPSVVQSTSYSTMGNTLPQGSPVNSVTVRCSLVDNPVANVSDVLDAFPITGAFGYNMSYSPSFEKWIRIRRGKYSTLTINLCDDNLQPLPAVDGTILLNLLIRSNRA